jgi:hypothetical protein
MSRASPLGQRTSPAKLKASLRSGRQRFARRYFRKRLRAHAGPAQEFGSVSLSMLRGIWSLFSHRFGDLQKKRQIW